MSSTRVTLGFLLLNFVTVIVSGVLKLPITPDRGTTLIISNNTRVSVEFQCLRHQHVFNVEVVRNIECTTKSCSGHIIQADSSSLPLLDFNRKFTWNLKSSALKAVKIDFSNTGLRQINPSDRCPDGHSYTLQAFQTTGNVSVGKYCRMGPVVASQILSPGSFSLEVPAGQKLQNGRFDVSVGEEIKSLAKMTVMVPKGTSSLNLLSPNFPDSFPDNGAMEWYFQVPDKHKTALQFLNVTKPHCLKKETAVEYHGKGRGAVVLSLSDPQPEQKQGHFTLTLRNCEMDTRSAASPGLLLNLKVSSSRTGTPVSCKVDLSRMGGLSLHIEKLRPTSVCEMKVNSVLKEKITVTSKSELTFQDCLPEDIQVTATKTIECSVHKDCSETSYHLSVPMLPLCLPAPLISMTWTLRPPQHGTVELTSTFGPLMQSLPGQQCNDSIIFTFSEDDGTTIGHFCTPGAIQKVQIHTNMSVTVSGMGGKALRTLSKPVLLEAVFKEEISERYIFTVSPKKDTPVLLATPGWPVGMKSYSTVSWIVTIPPKMEAHLMFANLSQPKCSNRHTNIRVQRVGCLEEEYSRREDEEAESEITVNGNFYLNMSNCMPERGDFSVTTKITLHKSKNLLLTIILSVVAALLVIFTIVLVVVCVVIRKKKKKMDHQVSIYNPNGTSFLPGPNGFPKTREDNESHVYASIEDSLVYTDLLRKGAEMGIYGELDTHQPFPGQIVSQKPLVSEIAADDDIPVGVYQKFQAPPLPIRPPSHMQALQDNVIYQTEDPSEEENSPNLGPRLEPEGGD
ncbi:hypothetical protein PBY51_017927 [Eleginops maclovinus]|uniref:CUB domain-containing protein 1 n=1 Tax=Eleginops maclovinus TaxID=56733 RepID=A0AAN8AND7_ELEMC|nr:hypothetical protein PBY51_017927 [Eleginops maclovinus]